MEWRALVLTSALLAAATAGEIRGTVHSPTGAVITGARVLLMNEDYVKLAETTSDEGGEFAFKDLQPALYFVQAKMSMFQLAQHHVFLKDGPPQRLYLIANVARGEDRFTAVVEGLPEAPALVRGPRISGKPEPFKRLSGRPPVMPDAVRKRGVHGTVALYATIEADGALTDIVTLESPDAELEQACRASFEKWRYAPMKLDGVPVKATTVVVFEFKPAAAKP